MNDELEAVPMPDEDKPCKVKCEHIEKYGFTQPRGIYFIEVSEHFHLYLCGICYGSVMEHILKHFARVKGGT